MPASRRDAGIVVIGAARSPAAGEPRLTYLIGRLLCCRHLGHRYAGRFALPLRRDTRRTPMRGPRSNELDRVDPCRTAGRSGRGQWLARDQARRGGF